MSVSVTMPQLGESVSEGTVTRWLKQEGDEVQADEPLLEVSTDKVDTEIPSPAAGVLTQIKVHEDETVEVGSELAVIGDSSDTSESRSSDQPAAETHAEEAPAEQDSSAQQDQQEPKSDQQQAQQTEQQDEEQPEQKPAQQQSEQQPAQQSSQQSGSDGGTPVVLPALGESVTEGTVTRWLK
ncbi:MAG TPA: biotin/lipoyl-containing protein, partial [Actinomycetes bacterium]|nr:biotin/lipoyl-containing protein [Actinomycetes bacterium]